MNQLNVLLLLVGCAVHLFVCALGARWGGERGRAGEGLFLALFFSIFGLIAIACVRPERDANAEKLLDATRAVERQLGALLKELQEQGATQNTLANNTLATAKLLGILAKNIEPEEA